MRRFSQPARTVASAALTALTVRKPRNRGCTAPTVYPRGLPSVLLLTNALAPSVICFW